MSDVLDAVARIGAILKPLDPDERTKTLSLVLQAVESTDEYRKRVARDRRRRQRDKCETDTGQVQSSGETGAGQKRVKSVTDARQGALASSLSDLDHPLSQQIRRGEVTDTGRAGAIEAAQLDAPVGADAHGVAPVAPTTRPEPAGSPSGTGVRSPRGSRLPADWRPEAHQLRFAADLGIDAPKVAAVFRDYWIARPGKEGVKLDWDATWRNWCRRDAESGRGGVSAPGQPSDAQARRALALRGKESQRLEEQYERERGTWGPPPPDVQRKIADLFARPEPASGTRLRTAAEQVEELEALDRAGGDE